MTSIHGFLFCWHVTGSYLRNDSDDPRVKNNVSFGHVTCDWSV